MVKTEDTVNLEQKQQGRYCLNCSTSLTDQYCPHCGQKDIPRRQTLGELCFNFFSSFTGYESKFFKTVRYLLLKPGLLAIEYNAGKRERYFHPARMYVFISFVYFLLLTSLPEAPNERSIVTITSTPDQPNDNDISDEKEFTTRESYDSAQLSLPVSERDGWMEKKWTYRQIELEKRLTANPKEFASKVVEEFTGHFSQVFFLLLPIFAFMLWLLYKRKDFFYHEHLVFSIWCYNFFFIVGALAMLAEMVVWLNWLAVALKFTIFIYLLLAMKRAYHQSWGKTVVKYFAFVAVFGICVVTGLFINLLITLILI
jgi:hypothetical protein